MAETKINLSLDATRGYGLVSSQTVSAVTDVSFTGLTEGLWYSLRFGYTQGVSSGQTQLRFNNSSSNVYRWAAQGRADNNSTTSNYASDNSFIGITAATNLNGWYCTANIDFIALATGECTVLWSVTYVDTSLGNVQTYLTGGGLYNDSGGGAVSSVQVIVTNGTMSGTFNLLKLIQ